MCRLSVRSKHNLFSGVALALLGGLTAGCSSDMSRFTTDDFTTASIRSPNQQAVIARNTAPAQVAVDTGYEPPVTGSTSSVSRSSLPPPAASAPVSSAPVRTASLEPKPLAAPKPVRQAEPAIDPMSRAVERSAEPAPPAPAPRVASSDPAGWSSVGGSQITAKEGETVYNLSRRYGVPADVLMKVNGIDSSGGLKAGQKVIIPTYVYSDRAPVSAPDSNPKVAASKSSRGLKQADAPLTDGQKLASAPSSVRQPSAVPSKGGYTVVSGDTLSGVARRNGVSVKALRSANGLDEGAPIKIGQTLLIPPGGEAVAAARPSPKPVNKIDPVQTASTPAPKKQNLAAASTKAEPAAYTPPASSKAIAAVEKESKEAAPNSTGIDRMRWPVTGRVAKSRDGIDIQVPTGTPVKAAENGVVIYAGDGLKDFGNTVLVRHDNGLVTVYGHADQLMVKRGQKVKRGEEIATAGMSGAAQTPKLHFEVRKNSAPVDPSTYLE